jgi:hypothetical protein
MMMMMTMMMMANNNSRAPSLTPTTHYRWIKSTLTPPNFYPPMGNLRRWVVEFGGLFRHQAKQIIKAADENAHARASTNGDAHAPATNALHKHEWR